jgi:hypothetical protein
VITCDHRLGMVGVAASQDLVSIEGRRVLVEPDPEGRPIAGCPNVGGVIKPCLLTLEPEAGYSALVRIDGRPVCLEPLSGRTDGTPPGVVRYGVRSPGQSFVSERT